MEDIHLCELCQRACEPEEVNGVKALKHFQGYIVDVRLQQFSKTIWHEEGPSLEMIAFASPKGKALLARMHEEVTR